MCVERDEFEGTGFHDCAGLVSPSLQRGPAVWRPREERLFEEEEGELQGTNYRYQHYESVNNKYVMSAAWYIHSRNCMPIYAYASPKWQDI